MSELTLTIICVSVPALRPLYNKVTGGSSTGGPYHQQSSTKVGTGTGTGNYKMKHMTTSKTGANQYDCEIGTGDRNADNDSDTFILHDADKETGSAKTRGITKSNEVTVTYEDGLSATTTKQHV
jgi:hypothetical protein